MREWHARDEAWQRARSFARRFGEPHVRLAMHGAAPIGLTPELLHLIRMNFVAATPWVAEADLLLSPLCRDVGGGFFEMDEELRGLLVEELQRDPDFGPGRLQAIAGFLGAWADRMREAASDPEWSDFVEGQALTALSYRKPEEAAEALARSLNSHRGRAGIDARVIKLTQGLSSALMSQVEVVTYAVALDKLAAGDVEAALEHFGALGPMDQPVKIGSVNLPAPVEWGVAEQQVEEAIPPSEASEGAEEGTPDVELIGESAAMRQVRATIERIAPTAEPVLIRGETGTGKEVAARAIHRASTRSGKPFITLDCVALSETELEEELFGRPESGGQRTVGDGRKVSGLEAAQGGTLFLDEIDGLPQALQPRLLSVLQERELTRVNGVLVEVNVRILAATHLDLEAPARASVFLQDLFRRLNAENIVMPPLRERGEDVMILAEYFASKFSHRYKIPVRGIPPEVRERLLGYEWPGNVRELVHVMERVVILGSGNEVRLEDLPDEIRNAPVSRGRVLIAYGSGVKTDREVASKIAAFLNAAGYDVFEAPQSFMDESALTQMILSRIRESKAVSVVYGKDSAASPWLTSLVDFALKEHVPMLPVVVGESQSLAWIPRLLAPLHHIRWVDSQPDSSLESLRATLETLRPPAAPQPALAAPEFIYVSCTPEDREIGTAIREHLRDRRGKVWLDDRNVPPRERGEPSLEFLLKPGHLMIVIVSERGASNEWLQEEVRMALELRTQILPIQIGNLGWLPPPLSRLRGLQWIEVEKPTNAAVFGMLAEIDRYIAAFEPRSAEATDDLYIETAAARDARGSVLSGASLIVRAPRRSGKTALLRYLGRALAEQNITTGYMDLERESEYPSGAVLLVDNVEHLKEVLDYFSRRQRQTQCVLAAPAASGLGESYMHPAIVELQDLTLEETADLNRRLGSPLQPHQIDELFDLLDGHPYLTHAAITAAADGQPVEAANASELQPIKEELDILDHELGAGDLRRAWTDLLSGARLDKQAQDSLLALGLAKKRNGRLVPRNRLYREFFRPSRRDLNVVLISTPDRDLPCARAVRNWLRSRNKTVLEFNEFGILTESYDSQVEQLLDRADLVVGLVAATSGGRGNIAEIRIACGRYRIEGRPKIFTVLVRRDRPPSELMDVWHEIQSFNWNSEAETPALLRELAAILGEDEPVAVA